MTNLELALERFRHTWQKHPREFTLKFYAAFRVNKEKPLLRNDERFFCPILLPFTDDSDTEHSLTGIITTYKGQISEEAITDFKFCCIAAGTSLVNKYFALTKPYTDGNFIAGSTGPESHFLALLARAKKFVIHSDKNNYLISQDVFLSMSPWQESISLLEEIIAEQSPDVPLGSIRESNEQTQAKDPTISTKVHASDGKGVALQEGNASSQLVAGFLGGEALTNALGIHPTRIPAFNQQLSRQRIKLGDDCWHEVRDPRPNNPRFLYRADSPKLQALAADYKSPKPA